tara:strand:+ start:1576 stop:1845 length:270 start_codon:yes stop_codon:yes gene_type:complete
MHTCISNNKRNQRLTSYGEAKIMHPALVRYEELLKKHDWTYMYSDDHRAWKKGSEEAEELRSSIDILCGLGLDQIACEMHTKYSPFSKG